MQVHVVWLDTIRFSAVSLQAGRTTIFLQYAFRWKAQRFSTMSLQAEFPTVFYSVLAAGMSERRLNVSYETAFMIGHLALTDIHDGILLSSIIFRRPYVLGRVASIFYLPDDE